MARAAGSKRAKLIQIRSFGVAMAVLASVAVAIAQRGAGIAPGTGGPVSLQGLVAEAIRVNPGIRAAAHELQLRFGVSVRANQGGPGRAGA